MNVYEVASRVVISVLIDLEKEVWSESDIDDVHVLLDYFK